MVQPAKTAQQAPRISAGYAALWALGAGLAGVYALTLAVNPQLLTQVASLVTVGPDAGVRHDTVEIDSALGDIKRDIARLEDRVAARESDAKLLTARLATLEERTPALAPVASATPPDTFDREASERLRADHVRTALAQAPVMPAPAAGGPVRDITEQTAEPRAAAEPRPPTRIISSVNGAEVRKTDVPANIAALALEPEPDTAAPQPPRVETRVVGPTANRDAPAGKPAARIVTGSIPAPAADAPITFGPPVVSRAPRTVGIQLTTGPSVDALRQAWAALSQQHGAQLKRLAPRYVASKAPGEPYALLAGPLNERDAKRICGRLKASHVPCETADFIGNAL